MQPITAAELATIAGGNLVSGPPDRTSIRVCTDTRALSPGCIFFALKGLRTDGHEFVGEAADRGATAVCVERPRVLAGGVAVVTVPSTLAALHRLASWQRSKLQCRVVGITGSSGKTSTKEMLAAILRHRGTRFVASLGSYNNEVGVPLTILEGDRQTEVFVLEMGMRGAGQIAELADFAGPDIGVITNIGESHVGLLGSVEEIARAKGELAEALPNDGFLCLNRDDQWVEEIAGRTNASVVHFGLSEEADVRADEIAVDRLGHPSFFLHVGGATTRVNLGAPGLHQVANALAASAAATALGASTEEIADGLAQAPVPPMRMERVVGPSGSVIINDAYNASPTTVNAALAAMAHIDAARRFALLGDMKELGEFSRAGHHEAGSAAARFNVDRLLAVGEWAPEIIFAARSSGMDASSCLACSDVEEAVEILAKELREGDLLLVKASRAVELDRAVDLLRKVSE